MFKTELHCHTSPISNCAHISPEETVEQYISAGYTTLVITNHLSPTFFKLVASKDMTDEHELTYYYLSDYRRAKKQAGDRLNVLLGMELRVKENMNDYLIYGIDEQFVYDIGIITLMDKRLKEISPLVRNLGALIFQAHPFRNAMTITNPSLIDGVEVYNSTRNHLDRNEFALLWAEKYGLLKIAGSDYHNRDYLNGTGILTDIPITDSLQLKEILQNQNFTYTDGERIIKP